MTHTYTYRARRARRLAGAAALLLCLLLCLPACNDKKEAEEEKPGYIMPSDVAVTGFYIKKDSKVLANLDSVFFSIDLQRGVIFNADSLPKGTRVTDLIPVISYSSQITGAYITMEGGAKRDGTVDYKANPSDSIDFSGAVTLELTSAAGNSRAYRLKVNVHRTEPDSLCWGETALAALPSRLPAPRAQKAVQTPEGVRCLLQESDGSYTFASTADPGTEPWKKQAVSLPFTPRLRTLTALGSRVAVLGADGALHLSDDGVQWTDAPVVWDNILGGFGPSLLGLRTSGSGRVIASWPAQYPECPVPDGFPVDEYTNMFTYQSQWMATPVCVLSGGVTATGEPSSRVWGFDGTRWAPLSADVLPALRGAVLVPYYAFLRTGGVWNYSQFSTVMCVGGLDAAGQPNHDVYLSYDNGVNWSRAPELMQLPGFIPAMWDADAAVVSQKKQGSLASAWSKMPGAKLPAWYRVEGVATDGYDITWQCPYIYLIGGCDPAGSLYDTIWRGVLNRLSFMPII